MRQLELEDANESAVLYLLFWFDLFCLLIPQGKKKISKYVTTMFEFYRSIRYVLHTLQK